MPRLLLCSGLLAFSLVAPEAALAQALPLGSIFDAIGRAQDAAPAPEIAPPQGRDRRVAPEGRATGRKSKPARQRRYYEPYDSGSDRSYLGNG